ncbi:hypothetical protein EXM65_09050 [Clostridium botulinum]|uniref:Uncharacterized protein n=1 Tax=Clostridium botulinum TaxID=1491 RepID=A0A6M0SSF7_CLOBO|nr:hypothetical protein [Clostridium botulinum]
MNYEQTKELISNIIDNEFNHVQDENLEGMDNLEEYKKIAEKVNAIQTKLFEVLPNEYKDLVDRLDVEMWEKFYIEIRHYFKKGVIAGTTNLEFLKDTEIMQYI